MSIRITFAFAASLLSGTIAMADPGWMLTTADLRQTPVDLRSIDASGVHLNGASDVPLSRFVQVERPGSSVQSGEKFTLFLSGGDQLLGAPAGYKDEQVIWKSGIIGQVLIPIRDIKGLARAGKVPDALDQPRTDDSIKMSNGDSIKGVVSDISQTAVKISANGSDMDVPVSSIDTLLFAQTTKPGPSDKPQYRLRLSDGSTITAARLDLSADAVSFSLGDDPPRKLPLASIRGIEQLNGPVAFLSSRTPQAIIQIPYFGSTPWPTRMDMTVGGHPIQLAGRTYSRGIGVHSYSRLDYALDGAYAALRTQYAIAADARNQYADVTVRIKLDGKTVHEAPHFRADSVSPVVVLDIPRSAKLLSLEVDYGDANDTQDRFNWIEPALLKTKPAPPPSTKPATQPTDLPRSPAAAPAAPQAQPPGTAPSPPDNSAGQTGK